MKTPPPELVYKNINIWVGTFGYATPKNIKHAEVTFKVPIEWMEANNIDPDTIEMKRYDDGWGSLPTRKIGTNENDIFYEASTVGFSSFVITGKKSTGKIDYQSYRDEGTSFNIDTQQQEMNFDPDPASGQEEKESNYNNYLLIGAFIGVIMIPMFGNKVRMNKKK